LAGWWGGWKNVRQMVDLVEPGGPCGVSLLLPLWRVAFAADCPCDSRHRKMVSTVLTAENGVGYTPRRWITTHGLGLVAVPELQRLDEPQPPVALATLFLSLGD